MVPTGNFLNALSGSRRGTKGNAVGDNAIGKLVMKHSNTIDSGDLWGNLVEELASTRRLSIW
jgi:hypothetical protein